MGASRSDRRVRVKDEDPLATLDSLRAAIDAIDERLLDLLAERFALTRRVGAIKAELRLPPVDPIRKASIAARIHDLAATRQLKPQVVTRLYDVLLDAVADQHRRASQRTRQ